MDLFTNKNISITSSTIKDYKTGNSPKKIDIQGRRGIHTLSVNSLTHFTPLNFDKEFKLFATMDIETMRYKNNQIPIAITTFIPNIGSKLFIIDNPASKDIDLLVNNL
jgi:hypothetical protein